MSKIFERSAGVAGMRDYLLGLQTRIMGALQAIEDEGEGGAKAVVDPWK